MSKENILRLALILGNSQAQTFITNLAKIVELVLYDHFAEYVKISTIVNDIKQKFFLEFQDIEVFNAIKNKRGIVEKKRGDFVDNLYSLTPEEYQKIKEKQTSHIDDFIKLFKKENSSLELSFDETKELIYRFLYFTFNSDTKTVLDLMNRTKYEQVKHESNLSKEFSSKEARVINLFLEWDNKNKNEYILNLISACFDYCMLTIKKDHNIYSHIFRGKKFYLDTNIIFRLAGFNKEERKTVLVAFINKCKNSGIKICYTNHTKDELMNTIKYHVDGLHKLLKNRHPISIDAISKLDPAINNDNFYEKYVDWCMKPINHQGDFRAFRIYLEQEVNAVIRDFQMVTFDDHNRGKTKEKFDELSNEFYGYKIEQYKHAVKKSINIDINNYMYFVDKNDNKNASDFLGIDDYFITADHSLTEWAAKRRPGAVPIFVLPSVWYSVLLKYKGRTENDYKSFCQFLSIRIAPDPDPLKTQKLKMLDYILQLNENSDMKDRIIYDVDRRLQDGINEIEDPESFAEESHQTILDKMIRDSESAQQKRYESEMEDYRKESNRNLETIKEEHKKEVDSVKGISFHDGQLDMIKRQAKKRARRNKLIKIIGGSIVAIFLFGVILSLLILFKLDNPLIRLLPEWYNNNATFILIIEVLISAFWGIINWINKYIGFLSSNEDEIFAKMKRKMNL